jgi:hypothetical protein
MPAGNIPRAVIVACCVLSLVAARSARPVKPLEPGQEIREGGYYARTGAKMNQHILWHSARTGDVGKLEWLLHESGGGFADIHEVDLKSGFAALHWASGHGSRAAVISLLAHGASVNQQTGEGVTPLICAASTGHVEVVSALLEAGADHHLRERKFNLRALEVAAVTGQPGVVERLLAAGMVPGEATFSLARSKESDRHTEVLRLLEATRPAEAAEPEPEEPAETWPPRPLRLMLAATLSCAAVLCVKWGVTARRVLCPPGVPPPQATGAGVDAEQVAAAEALLGGEPPLAPLPPPPAQKAAPLLAAMPARPLSGDAPAAHAEAPADSTRRQGLPDEAAAAGVRRREHAAASCATPCASNAGPAASCAPDLGAVIDPSLERWLAAVLPSDEHEPSHAARASSASSTPAEAGHAPPANLDSLECVVCWGGPRSHCFVPCGHQCVCAACAEATVRTIKACCPMCRAPVERAVKVFKV